jgi:hypothetical protein
MMQPPQKKPLGEEIDFTDEELGQMAEVSFVDVKIADALWQSMSPVQLKNLLQATVQEEPDGH